MEVILRKYAFTNLLWLGMLSYPREVLAYLYGRKENGFVDVKEVLGNLNGKKYHDECELLDDDVLGCLEKNLVPLEGRIIGDFHTHPEQVKRHRLVGFKSVEDYIKRINSDRTDPTKPSCKDKKTMEKNGRVYMIGGLFRKGNLLDTTSTNFNGDVGLSKIFNTIDFLFCLSAWHYSRSRKEFVKATIKIEGLDLLL